jgi:hypothetical protein
MQAVACLPFAPFNAQRFVSEPFIHDGGMKGDQLWLSDYNWAHMSPSEIQSAMAHFKIGECTVKALIENQLEREALDGQGALPPIA